MEPERPTGSSVVAGGWGGGGGGDNLKTAGRDVTYIGSTL